MGVPPLGLHLQQVTRDLIEQSLPPVRTVHRQAADGVGKAAAGGNQPQPAVKDAAGIVQISVPPDTLLLQKGVHLGLPAFVQRGYGGQRFTHGIIFPFIGWGSRTQLRAA